MLVHSYGHLYIFLDAIIVIPRWMHNSLSGLLFLSVNFFLNVDTHLSRKYPLWSRWLL